MKGDKVKITSRRGYIKAVAVVTKRLKDLEIEQEYMETSLKNCQTELKKVSEQILKEIRSVQTQMTKTIELCQP